MDNLPIAQQNTVVTPPVGSNKPSSLRRIFTLMVIVIAFAVALIGSFWFYKQYFSREVKAMHDLNSLINLIQNPNPQLIAACNPQPHLLKQDQELIIYGDRELPDPQKYAQQKFTKPGLADVRMSLEFGDRVKASEQLATIWQRISNPIGCAAGKDEFVRWNAKEIETQDPQRQFIPSAAKLTIVSEIKQEAVKQFLKLWYGLNK